MQVRQCRIRNLRERGKREGTEPPIMDEEYRRRWQPYTRSGEFINRNSMMIAPLTIAVFGTPDGARVSPVWEQTFEIPPGDYITNLEIRSGARILLFMPFTIRDFEIIPVQRRMTE